MSSRFVVLVYGSACVNSKHQIPSTRQITITKHEIFGFGICLLDLVWFLGFVVSNFFLRRPYGTDFVVSVIASLPTGRPR